MMFPAPGNALVIRGVIAPGGRCDVDATRPVTARQLDALRMAERGNGVVEGWSERIRLCVGGVRMRNLIWVALCA